MLARFYPSALEMDYETFMSNTKQVELYDGRDPLFELTVCVDLENYFNREPETDGNDGTECMEPEELV